MVRDVVEHLCSRLEGFRDTKEPVNLRHAFAAVAMDVVTEYAFGTSYKCLEDPLFAPMWPEAVDSVSEQSVSTFCFLQGCLHCNKAITDANVE